MKVALHASIAAFALATGWVPAASHARADAIDGIRCNGSRSVQVDGPAVATPTGRWRRCKLTG